MLRDRTAEYRRGNSEAARIVLEHPDVYGPGLVRWAELHLARHGQQQQATAASVGTAREPEQMVLFERTEAA